VSLFLIAVRSIQQRGVASMLTIFSMALGVMMVVAVLSIHGVISESFRNNASLGYNMIVGATKGGKLQLVLNTVFYLSEPVENIPYEYYLELKSKEQREKEYKFSLASHAEVAERELAVLQQYTGMAGPAGMMALGAIEQVENKNAPALRDGEYASFTAFAIPLCLGDYLGRFRVVGTTPDIFDELVRDVEEGTKYEFAAGRNFKTWSKEHAYFEAVLGATVARELNMKVGDEFSPAHGEPGGHGHEQKFTVVGVLKPSGTPQDRAAFVNIEGFYLMADHAKPIKKGEKEEGEEADGSAAVSSQAIAMDRLPVEQREVTSVLLRTSSPMYSVFLEQMINESDSPAQAALPVKEIYNLFEIIVNPIRWALLGLTAMICVVSGVSIMVSIYNSMNDRRQEIAVMRALGAGRGTVMMIVLLESVLLSIAGGLIGWVLAHGVNVLVSGVVEQRTGVSIGFFDLAPPVNLPDALGMGFSGFIAMAVLLAASALVVLGGGVWQVISSLKNKDSKWLPGVLLLLVGLAASVCSAWFIYTQGEISVELVIIPGLLLLAVVVGFLPAFTAYRTDVAAGLQR